MICILVYTHAVILQSTIVGQSVDRGVSVQLKRLRRYKHAMHIFLPVYSKSTAAGSRGQSNASMQLLCDSGGDDDSCNVSLYIEHAHGGIIAVLCQTVI